MKISLACFRLCLFLVGFISSSVESHRHVGRFDTQIPVKGYDSREYWLCGSNEDCPVEVDFGSCNNGTCEGFWDSTVNCQTHLDCLAYNDITYISVCLNKQCKLVPTPIGIEAIHFFSSYIMNEWPCYEKKTIFKKIICACENTNLHFNHPMLRQMFEIIYFSRNVAEEKLNRNFELAEYHLKKKQQLKFHRSIIGYLLTNVLAGKATVLF